MYQIEITRQKLLHSKIAFVFFLSFSMTFFFVVPLKSIYYNLVPDRILYYEYLINNSFCNKVTPIEPSVEHIALGAKILTKAAGSFKFLLENLRFLFLFINSASAVVVAIQNMTIE